MLCRDRVTRAVSLCHVDNRTRFKLLGVWTWSKIEDVSVGGVGAVLWCLKEMFVLGTIAVAVGVIRGDH